MSVREYLREKAAESRHNELSAYLMFIAGSVLFIGGVMETLFVAETVDWILFIPVNFTSTPGCILGLALTLSGLALMIFGLAVGIYFSRDRAWYMRELQSSDFIGRNAVERKKKRAQATRLKAAKPSISKP